MDNQEASLKGMFTRVTLNAVELINGCHASVAFTRRLANATLERTTGVRRGTISPWRPLEFHNVQKPRQLYGQIFTTNDKNIYIVYLVNDTYYLHYHTSIFSSEIPYQLAPKPISFPPSYCV